MRKGATYTARKPSLDPKGVSMWKRITSGLIKPNECPLFGKACTPSARSLGMASVVGSCAVRYKYGIGVAD